ncbi:Src kinase-associated phosphoprotein 2, partial [Nibea albiflora]
MRQVPEELTTLISDLENFLNDGLKGENLSKKAKEKKEAFIKRIKEVKLGVLSSHSSRLQRVGNHCFTQSMCHYYIALFTQVGGDDSEEEEEADSNNDGGSLLSERTDKDEDAGEDHSFFGTEWQKRWCALSHQTFYYYGSEKDKQQKGEFNIDGYNVKMNNTLRKDSKKDCCFEISAPDKRVYQFCASSAKEAEEWVKQIDFVLKDMTGIIPEEDDEEQEMYDDVGRIDEDIYEELPVDKSTDYVNYYQGLWDCTGDFPDELSFKRGDAIYILSK